MSQSPKKPLNTNMVALMVVVGLALIGGLLTRLTSPKNQPTTNVAAPAEQTSLEFANACSTALKEAYPDQVGDGSAFTIDQPYISAGKYYVSARVDSTEFECSDMVSGGMLAAGLKVASPAPQPTETALQAEAVTTPIKPLSVVSWKCEPEPDATDYIKFIGEVKNQGGTSLENVVAAAVVSDEAGIVAKNETLIDYKNLRPGETSPFEVLVDTGGRSGECSLGFRHAFGDRIDAEFSQ